MRRFFKWMFGIVSVSLTYLVTYSFNPHECIVQVRNVEQYSKTIKTNAESVDQSIKHLNNILNPALKPTNRPGVGKTFPPVYFITLHLDPNRVEHVRSLIEANPYLNGRMWPATTTTELEGSDLKPYLNLDSYKNIRRGALGCAISHIKVLEYMVEHSIEECIIFEDDVTIAHNFEALYKEFREHLPHSFDFVQFLHHKDMNGLRGQKKFAIPGNNFVLKSYAPYGTVGYLITLKGAKKVLPTLRPVWGPIDEMYRSAINKGTLNSFMPSKDLILMPYKLVSNIWSTKQQPKSSKKPCKSGKYLRWVKRPSWSSFDVDFVIPSSLGVDPSEYSLKDAERHRVDDHSLYWLLISISKNAPWVRNVFILLNGKQELPYKLNGSLRITVVDRCRYMTHCPTKNSFAVATMVHKIPNLSEHFIYCNDDVIFGKPAAKSDFFAADGKPRSWRKAPNRPTSEGVQGEHHRMYANVEVFQGETPTTSTPMPHFMFPMLKSYASTLARKYSEWYGFVESHSSGRFSSLGKENSQEEDIKGVWESNLITSGQGVYKNIDSKRYTWWDEVIISEKGFADAISKKPLFMNVNDRFSKEPKVYKQQIKFFWEAMEKLFGVPMAFKDNISKPRASKTETGEMRSQKHALEVPYAFFWETIGNLFGALSPKGDISKPSSFKTEKGEMPNKKPVHILAAPYGPESGVFKRILHLDEDKVIDICGKSVTTEWSVDVPDSISTADIVWMDCVHVDKNIKKLNDKLKALWIKKPKFQKWICASTETSDYYPHLYPLQKLKKRFPDIDMFSTNRFDSDIPLIEIGKTYGVTVDSLNRPKIVPVNEKTKKALLIYSNCNETRSGREEYIIDFINTFPSLVANHGKCWGGSNGNMTKSAYTENGVNEKISLLKTHMFTFCIENSFVDDYVSEKVFQALAYGSIPIFKGAPNAAKEILPCSRCVIWVDDFPTASDLGAHLNHLIANRTAYEEYFHWRRSPRKDIIERLKLYSLDTALCRWANATSSYSISSKVWPYFLDLYWKTKYIVRL